MICQTQLLVSMGLNYVLSHAPVMDNRVIPGQSCSGDLNRDFVTKQGFQKTSYQLSLLMDGHSANTSNKLSKRKTKDCGFHIQDFIYGICQVIVG